ncbi:hypothetical protein PYW08_007835 [Mythimna loreyi]|uniref:Uncharacterized protein n=1 Tax=Mythimna loreyi TaxID=667449 RepID=A0ACC2QDA7_9NEOP|nr:hypothetical protein PYW08_007835 [Mythimna loreyi]
MSRVLDMMWSAILLISMCGLVQSQFRVDPLVSTKGGLIRGLRSDQGYSKFLGVPYAVVDKNNPFGAALPHPGFDNIFEAYESNACLQIENDAVIGDIDCLTLDIYVPTIANSHNRLPVMIWIHGGGFGVGSASAFGTPNPLLRNDVIVVAINYRLGIYGFMCLDIPEVPGNQGLKDQVLALRWINENIEAFGGNAKQITAFGQSAGGVSINLHLLSPYESLFQKAIIQSGPALSPWALVESNITIPSALAAALDFDTDDIHEALDYLASIDPRTLTKLAYDLQIISVVGIRGTTPQLYPCIEKDIEGVEHFITEDPMNLVSPKVSNTPIIIGNTDNEIAFMYENADADFLSNYNFDLVTLAFDFGDNLEDALSNVRHFYIGDEKASENVKDEITDFASDFIYNHPTQRMAERFLDIGTKTVYRYVFSYSGDRNYFKSVRNLNSTGAVHADEIGYQFDSDLFSGDTITHEDQLMIDRLATLWTNFAKYGDPTPSTSELLPVKWEPITKTSQPYLSLDSDLTLEARPFQERMSFWDIFYRVYRDQQKWLQVIAETSRVLDMMWSTILLISVCGLVQGQFRVDPLVSTKGGLIRGLRSDQGYSQFLGVPYAVVDKNNPFGAATPHPGFDGVFEAYESNACLQVENDAVIGTIDCLTLDVYVPSIANSQNRLPVMVWIHGGAFVTGSATAFGSPNLLLMNDVIIVAINYRLGIYGFMCLDIPEVPGNQGLKDQVLALRWINENIEAFGGNAKQITVFGESAGGISVNLHLLSSYESLFQKAIIQSGPALSPWALVDSNITVPLALAAALDFNTDNIHEALDYLVSIDPRTLTQLAFDLGISSFVGTEIPLIYPCIEKDIEDVEHFITEDPVNLVSNKIRNMPIIIGNTDNEMPFLYGNADADFFSNYNFDLVNLAFNFGDNLEDAGDRNYLKISRHLNSTGAIHADELGYLFDSDIFSGDTITPEDQLMIDRITTLWTNFAKYGDPTPDTSELLPVKWEPITKTSQPYLSLDSDLTLEARPFQEKMSFWDIFYRLYRDQQKWLQGSSK